MIVSLVKLNPVKIESSIVLRSFPSSLDRCGVTEVYSVSTYERSIGDFNFGLYGGSISRFSRRGQSILPRKNGCVRMRPYGDVSEPKRLFGSLSSKHLINDLAASLIEFGKTTGAVRIA